ncbi:hypothetical protein Tco_0987021 [Tanacetum coccineum]
METQNPLLKDEDGEEVDVHMYRSMIGSLMYLTSSRPDIMFAVCACARYQVNPKVSHLHVVKRIFRYLKGQPKLGLWYPKDSPFDLVAYTDSDYAGASLDRKSTTGEAEYVAASSCCGQVLWIQNQLLDYGYNFMHTKIFIDNNIMVYCLGQKILMGEVLVNALVDGKMIIVTKSTVIRVSTIEVAEDEAVHKELGGRSGEGLPYYLLALEEEAGQLVVVLGAKKPWGILLLKLGEDASKQGRRIKAIDADEDITLVNVQDDADNEMFDVDALNDEEVFVVEQEVANEKDADGEITLAQALIEIKSTKPKVKGVVIQEPGESTTTKSSQLSSQQSQDKGKGIMIEEPVKPKKKDVQIMLDEEAAKKLQDEFDEEERLAREKDEANIALTEEWDDIQAKIEADHELAQRLQAEEQEALSDAEKAILFQQLIEKRRKHFAAKRVEEQRNKPPTQAQQRKIMFTYLKNMKGKKLKYLKKKSFDSIRWMFDRAFKRQKVDEDKDTAELQSLMEVIPDEEEVAIDVVPLAIKSPSIVGWKIHKEGKKSYYQIMRADGKSQMYRIFSHMLKSFSREDLEDLYKLVKAKYESTRPVEDLDLLLWGDLKTMFEPHVEDTVWRNQQDYKVLEWKLYDSCGVHSLRMQHVYIYMLVEKRYPLTPSIITDMLNKKLQVDYFSEMAYQLLKLLLKTV